jgi:hypothetical protein
MKAVATMGDRRIWVRLQNNGEVDKRDVGHPRLKVTNFPFSIRIVPV